MLFEVNNNTAFLPKGEVWFHCTNMCRGCQISCVDIVRQFLNFYTFWQENTFWTWTQTTWPRDYALNTPGAGERCSSWVNSLKMTPFSFLWEKHSERNHFAVMYFYSWVSGCVCLCVHHLQELWIVIKWTIIEDSNLKVSSYGFQNYLSRFYLYGSEK